MRIAGAFAEAVLGLVFAGLAVTTWAVAQNGPPSDGDAPAEASRAEEASRAGNLPPGGAKPQAAARPAAPAAVAKTLTAAPVAVEARPVAAVTAAPTAAAQPVTLPPVRPVPPPAAPQPAIATPIEPTLLATSPTPATPSAAAAPSAAAPTPAASEAAEPDKGGTPGLKPAKVLFGTVATPAPLAARAIGTYAKGCLSGAQALPVDGPAWQAMRLSRNRNWGHPQLISLVQKLAADGKAKDGWPGLLVGDLAQPRGGPMLSGHASHQIGLDADVWLTPMPDRTLSRQERETIEATSMLGGDGISVNRDVWTDGHFNIMKRAASYPEVERILVHPAIKQVLCYASGTDRGWLSKVRPYWGHYYHFHIRISCPPGSANCVPQKPVPGEDGCGKELDDWLIVMSKVKPAPEPLPLPQPPVAAAKEKPGMTLDQLPAECRAVLATGNPSLARDIAAAAQAASTAAARSKSAKAVPTPAPAASAPATPAAPARAPATLVAPTTAEPGVAEKKTAGR